MPIIDIELIAADDAALPQVPTARLASRLGAVFDSAPGRTWVRVRCLPRSAYAENDHEPDADELPVFVTVLLAHGPPAAALAEQVEALTQAVAETLGLLPRRVHVQYAPAAAGRQAFGGLLVR